MKQLKQKSLIIFSVLMLLASICLTYTARADSGFDSSWDSGGSSWGGGGSSWDSSDWGSSSYSGGGGYYGGPVSVVIIVVVVIVVIVSLVQAAKNKSSTTIIPNKQIYNEMSDEAINAIIADFDKSEFYTKAFETYRSIQEAWMNFDDRKLRDLVTDEMYNMYTMQMDTMKVKNEKNIMNDFAMIEAKIINVTNDNGVISIQVFMNIQMHDYLIDVNTGKIKRGTDSQIVDIDYILTFVKSASKGTKKGTVKCPNCGASVKLKASGKCEYCDSTIVINANDYVMSKKENVGQRLK